MGSLTLWTTAYRKNVWVWTWNISTEHCVRIVVNVEDRPSSTRVSRWVIFSVSISSRVCSRVLLSINAKHLDTHKITNVKDERDTHAHQNNSDITIPVNKLKNKILKLSRGWAQLHFHLQKEKKVCYAWIIMHKTDRRNLSLTCVRSSLARMADEQSTNGTRVTKVAMNWNVI